MTNSIARRSFVKLACAAAGTWAAGCLVGCASEAPAAGPQGERSGHGHHGKGHPEFNSPMNRAILINEAPAEEEALAKFIVISDTHIDLSYTPYVDRTRNVFEDIKQNCPDVDTIVVNGDITNHGLLEEYQMFEALAEATGFSYPDDFTLVIGNHDQYDSTEGAQAVSNLSDRFREQAQLTDRVHPYYDKTINGVHLICMGPDSYPDGNWAHFGISSEQVDWMDKLVMADKEAGTLSFVFLHEPLYKTVRDTQPGDFGHEWSLSTEDNNYLHEHIKRHENLVFFTGHTHALPDTLQLEGEDPLFVGTGSIAYCIDDITDDYMGNAEIDEYGSLGWEVTVWASCIRFRLRNFLTHSYEDDLGTAIYQF